MFTGLIEERGAVAGDPRPSGQGGVRLAVRLGPRLAAGLDIGASLAVSGVCLTVVEIAAAAVPSERAATAAPAPRAAPAPAATPAPAAHPAIVTLELAPETLARTTLGGLRDGAEVNLEPALRAGDPLGGHLVQGHVDGTAAVLERRDLEAHREIVFSLPPELAPFLVEKGSVTVDGVSLTVASLTADRFRVALLPHTLALTTLGALRPGDAVNLEVDVLAKYVQRMLAARGLVPAAPSRPEPAGAAGGAG
jgi:riboflavin synthase